MQWPRKRLQAAADVLAQLDVLVALAELARRQGYCRPAVVEAPVLNIVDGRHPVLDVVEPQGTFVPNDTVADAESGYILLITGPNMAGKSTYIRQVALLTLMAQTGSFVPARQATIGVADRIFARVGASDELSKGQSTFMVEMTETARILNTATARSLVILDEIGRGTSTYDGLSLAWAIVEHLHDQIQCRTLFATHYHELTDLRQTLPHVRNLNVAVKEWQEDVVFLHKIVEGAADKSYGIHVARLAGIPATVNERAKQILARLGSRASGRCRATQDPTAAFRSPGRRYPADSVWSGRTSVAGRNARAGRQSVHAARSADAASKRGRNAWRTNVVQCGTCAARWLTARGWLGRETGHNCRGDSTRLNGLPLGRIHLAHRGPVLFAEDQDRKAFDGHRACWC